ncbi:RecQ family ATP-dependent DNA helicase (plasmid) [Coraliomargarita sp. W4R53]
MTSPLGNDSIRTEALEALRALVGRPDADFHEGQFEAIEALVRDRARALVVQRTGWGKSAVYFVATLLLRRRGTGPTILVSPLLALMRDQVAAAERAGVRAVSINSVNAHEWSETLGRLNNDEVDVLLISPERLNNPRFRDEQLPSLISRIGLLVVDEAHCISDWGHDFRPDYRRLRDLISNMPPQVPVLATTATANERVVHDVEEQLGSGDTPVLTIRGPLARTSLRLGVLRLPDAATRLAWLLSNLDSLPGSGIIYTLTVSAAQDTARLLREAGHQVRAYTGQTDTAERVESERQLKQNEVKALVATSALGMGFDKPDLGFVVHLGSPSSPVAYYQQVGRAGRATANADVLLLPGPEDEAIWQYFATSSMPDQEKALAVIGELAHDGGTLSTMALETRVDLRRNRLELLLKVLDVDGAVERVQSGWRATGTPWHYDADRYGRIAAARAHEQQTMHSYEVTASCRMEFLQQSLDDATATPCGRCDNCTQPWFSTEISGSASTSADAALNRVGVLVEARAQWPSGMSALGVSLRGKIPADDRIEPGRALARLTDLGWGGPLRDMFRPDAPDAEITPAMTKALVRVLSEWEWDQRPVAVVAMPSRTHPRLVSSVAAALSQVGRLPWIGTLELTGTGPTNSRGNSAYRLAGVIDSFAVGDDLREHLTQLDGGPLLLIDDLIDSRWSVTVAGRLLRQAGASKILPLALAVSG